MELQEKLDNTYLSRSRTGPATIGIRPHKALDVASALAMMARKGGIQLTFMIAIVQSTSHARARVK